MEFLKVIGSVTTCTRSVKIVDLDKSPGMAKATAKGYQIRHRGVVWCCTNSPQRYGAWGHKHYLPSNRTHGSSVKHRHLSTHGLRYQCHTTTLVLQKTNSCYCGGCVCHRLNYCSPRDRFNQGSAGREGPTCLRGAAAAIRAQQSLRKGVSSSSCNQQRSSAI